MPKTIWIMDTGMLLQIARNSADSIKGPRRAGNNTQALVSVVFSVFALEAFMNEIAELAGSPLITKPDAITVLGEFLVEAEKSKASLESKFAIGNWILSGTRLDKGAPPYQDFAQLLKLRNDLAHFKPNDWQVEGVSAEEIHQTLLNRFKGKNLLADNINEENPSWTALVGTKALAEWACRTAAHMIVHFCAQHPPSEFRSNFLGYFEKNFDPKGLFPSE